MAVEERQKSLSFLGMAGEERQKSLLSVVLYVCVIGSAVSALPMTPLLGISYEFLIVTYSLAKAPREYEGSRSYITIVRAPGFRTRAGVVAARS